MKYIIHDVVIVYKLDIFQCLIKILMMFDEEKKKKGKGKEKGKGKKIWKDRRERQTDRQTEEFEYISLSPSLFWPTLLAHC